MPSRLSSSRTFLHPERALFPEASLPVAPGPQPPAVCAPASPGMSVSGIRPTWPFKSLHSASCARGKVPHVSRVRLLCVGTISSFVHWWTWVVHRFGDQGCHGCGDVGVAPQWPPGRGAAGSQEAPCNFWAHQGLQVPTSMPPPASGSDDHVPVGVAAVPVGVRWPCCSFHLLSPNDQGCSASFRELGHLCVFGDMSVQILSPF